MLLGNTLYEAKVVYYILYMSNREFGEITFVASRGGNMLSMFEITH